MCASGVRVRPGCLVNEDGDVVGEAQHLVGVGFGAGDHSEHSDRRPAARGVVQDFLGRGSLRRPSDRPNLQIRL